MIKKARQIIKLPYPTEATAQEKAWVDKTSGYINDNFKTMFDAVDELSREIASLKKQLDGTTGGSR